MSWYFAGKRRNNALQWRHNGRGGVSNHRRLYCLLNCVFRRGSKKTSKLHVTGLCEGNSPVTGEFPSQRASNAENVSCDDVIMDHHFTSSHWHTSAGSGGRHGQEWLDSMTLITNLEGRRKIVSHQTIMRGRCQFELAPTCSTHYDISNLLNVVKIVNNIYSFIISS